VFESFESAEVKRDGSMPMPKGWVKGGDGKEITEKCLGGHAVSCLGYDNKFVCKDGSVGAFIIRSSCALPRFPPLMHVGLVRVAVG
jgi:hypothetical protein